MDAVEYLKILARMHHKQEDCSHCVLPNGCDITKDEKEIKKRVEIIEKWGKENPIVTRQMKFLEMFPRAEVTDGALTFCPNTFDAGYREEKSCRNITCGECREGYWSEEVD